MHELDKAALDAWITREQPSDPELECEACDCADPLAPYWEDAGCECPCHVDMRP